MAPEDPQTTGMGETKKQSNNLRGIIRQQIIVLLFGIGSDGLQVWLCLKQNQWYTGRMLLFRFTGHNDFIRNCSFHHFFLLFFLFHGFRFGP